MSVWDNQVYFGHMIATAARRLNEARPQFLVAAMEALTQSAIDESELTLDTFQHLCDDYLVKDVFDGNVALSMLCAMRLFYDAFAILPSSVATDLQDRYHELWNEMHGPYFRCDRLVGVSCEDPTDDTLLQRIEVQWADVSTKGLPLLVQPACQDEADAYSASFDYYTSATSMKCVSKRTCCNVVGCNEAFPSSHPSGFSSTFRPEGVSSRFHDVTVSHLCKKHSLRIERANAANVNQKKKKQRAGGWTYVHPFQKLWTAAEMDQSPARICEKENFG